MYHKGSYMKISLASELGTENAMQKGYFTKRSMQ